MSSDDRRERLDLLRLYGALPFHQARKLLKIYATASQAWRRYPQWPELGVEPSVWSAAQTFTRSWAAASLTQLRSAGTQVLTPSMAGYPRALAAIDQPPPLLFIRGRWTPMDERAVSIVGTRRPTPYGEGVAADLARALAQAGVTVVSGLARGIDGVAHRAALAAGGWTVAVMGTGPDRIYPPEHRELARAIERQGALVTEYPPGMAPAPYAFPHRNRIIAALGTVTVVVEAGARSGALITARLADELSRPVYAVPGPLGRPQSLGCHRLIQDGALAACHGGGAGGGGPGPAPGAAPARSRGWVPMVPGPAIPRGGSFITWTGSPGRRKSWPGERARSWAPFRPASPCWSFGVWPSGSAAGSGGEAGRRPGKPLLGLQPREAPI